jgi:hypothetical protein
MMVFNGDPTRHSIDFFKFSVLSKRLSFIILFYSSFCEVMINLEIIIDTKFFCVVVRP